MKFIGIGLLYLLSGLFILSSIEPLMKIGSILFGGALSTESMVGNISMDLCMLLFSGVLF